MVNCKINKSIPYSKKLFIKSSLRKFGINPKNNGLMIFQEAIIYAYSQDMVSINLEEIYRVIAKNTNQSTVAVRSSLRYSFENIYLSQKDLARVYEEIFGLEFNIQYFNLKNLISDFIDILEEI